MTKIKTLYMTLFTVILSFAISTKVNANWHLDNDNSELSFISTKNQHVSETHHFSQLTGSLSETGLLNLEIDLASVETGIDVRNTRMREKLFLVDKFPKATLQALLPENIMQLKTGHSVTVIIPVKLTIMSTEKALTIPVQVSKTMDAQYIATSIQPVLIGAADFGLAAGVELLQQIAGLSSISYSVPVTFNLIFEPDE